MSRLDFIIGPGRLLHLIHQPSPASSCHGSRYTGCMSHLPSFSRLLRFAAPAIGMYCLIGTTPPAGAWEHEGHTMINRLAASTLPADVPAFLRTPAAIDEIEYLGPEPDRWRSPAEPELNAAQAPE